MIATSVRMYPHQKLDWTASRLEQRLAENPDDTEARLELARVCLSRGLFHSGFLRDGRDAQCSAALQHARRVLQEAPGAVEAIVIAGMALVGLDRPESAQKFLDEAVRLDPQRPDLHMALGAMYRAQSNRTLAVRHLELAVRGAPQSWEAHLLLGRTLSERARREGLGKPENARGQESRLQELGRVQDSARLLERSQYHMVQALKLEPSPDVLAPLIRDLGVSCIQTGRFAEAEKLFIRLRENTTFAPVARKHLGQVAFALGKYKNAIQHYRQYLDAHPDDAFALGQMGMAYLQLQELDKAKEYCHKALATDPHHLPARHALGCALLEEGQSVEAMRIFKETLQEHPEDMASYLELARTRRRVGDVTWLQRALTAEVSTFDRLPFIGGELSPRQLTRKRIAILLDELKTVGPSSIGPILQAVELTDDEALRFYIWEAACGLASSHVADEVSTRLREPGKHYSVALARHALAAAASLPEPTLTAGLNITMDDIQRAATERRGVATDVAGYRRAVEMEREQARAYQALLLLAIATRRSRGARSLLASWGKDSDLDLQVTVHAAQIMCGDSEAARPLLKRAQERGATIIVERLLAQVTPPTQRSEPHTVGEGQDVHCSSCGRTGREVTHLMAGTRAVLCNLCVSDILAGKASMAADDATCSLCGRSHFETRALYRYHKVDVCADCLDLSNGLVERDEVERFLASW